MTSATAAQPDHTGLDFTNVSKTYRISASQSVKAMTDFNMSLAPGEFVALLGPSGCGKSTALRIAAGLEDASEGSVSIHGDSPVELSARGALGVAFQDNALLPWLSVRSNIELPFKLLHRDVDKDHVDYLLDLVGLTKFEKARPKHLSGGMRQRVSIARSLVLRPEVLLLDEPFGALDAVTRHRLNVELAGTLRGQKTTTLLVTHSVEEAIFLADRVVVMTERPGTVKSSTDIPFGASRTHDTLIDPEFQKFVTDLTIELDHPHVHGEA